MLNYQNQGKYLANGIKLTDKIPQGMSFVSASNGGYVKDNSVFWDLADLNTQSNGTVTLNLRLNDVNNRSVLTNTANISGSSIESDNNNNQASIDTNISQGNANSASNSNTDNRCSDTIPQSAPQLISAVAGENSVTLTWKPAQDPVSYYLVAYGRTPGNWEYGNPNVGDRNTSSYTINELSGGTTYYFTVRAGNGCATGNYAGTLRAIPWGKSIYGAAQGFTSGVLGSKTQIAVSPQPQVLGDTTTSKPTCWWWLISAVLALIISSATLALWGSQRPKYWWLMPISLTLAAFIGDQYIAHQFFEPSKFCNFTWLWSVVSTVIPTTLFLKFA
jgi:hypothetical protein